MKENVVLENELFEEEEQLSAEAEATRAEFRKMIYEEGIELIVAERIRELSALSEYLDLPDYMLPLGGRS